MKDQKFRSVGLPRKAIKAAIDRVAELEVRVRELTASIDSQVHPRWRVREGRFSVSTTDKPAGTNRHDFRLVFGTNAVQGFEDHVWKEPGRITVRSA